MILRQIVSELVFSLAVLLFDNAAVCSSALMTGTINLEVIINLLKDRSHQ